MSLNDIPARFDGEEVMLVMIDKKAVGSNKPAEELVSLKTYDVDYTMSPLPCGRRERCHSSGGRHHLDTVQESGDDGVWQPSEDSPFGTCWQSDS